MMDAAPRCVAVVGGAGFIGATLVRFLLTAGLSVRVLDRLGSDELRGRFSSDLCSRLHLVSAQDDYGRALVEAFEGADAVVHLASTSLPSTSNLNMPADITSNLVVFVDLLEQARARQIRKVVYLSSGGTVYGQVEELPIRESHATNPICSYGIVKLAAEKYLRMHNVLYGSRHVALRLSNPYGPGQNPRAAQGAVAVFAAKIIRGEPIEIWGDGTVVRDYIHVRDVAAAIGAALVYRGAQCVFNIGSGKGVSLNELVQLLSAYSGRAAKVTYAPGRAVDVKANVLDISNARCELNWNPEIPLETGLGHLMSQLAQGEAK